MHLDHKEFKQEYRFLSLSNLYDNQILSGGHEKGEAYSFAEHGCGVCFVKRIRGGGHYQFKNCWQRAFQRIFVKRHSKHESDSCIS